MHLSVAPEVPDALLCALRGSMGFCFSLELLHGGKEGVSLAALSAK